MVAATLRAAALQAAMLRAATLRAAMLRAVTLLLLESRPVGGSSSASARR